MSIAATLLKEYIAIEPSVSKIIRSLRDKTNGRLAGIKHRIKSESSLNDKLMINKILNYKSAKQQIRDALRYTIVYKKSDYIKSVKLLIKSLKLVKHWKINKIKNYWKCGDPYNGINIFIVLPNDLKFELQLHTPRGLRAKTKNHKLYEEVRMGRRGDSAKRSMTRRADRNSLCSNKELMKIGTVM